MTDKELLDFLQACIDSPRGGTASFEKHRNCGLDSYDNQFDETNAYQIFTVASQHVRGASIRDVIENAIKASNENTREWTKL